MNIDTGLPPLKDGATFASHLFLILFIGLIGGTGIWASSGTLAVVGWDGLVYLENLSSHNHLQVALDGGGNCEVEFDLPEAQGSIPLIGPLVCR